LTDVFEEVEEQLRADRYRAAILKALPWVAGLLAAALLVALGVWGYQSYRTQSDNKASVQYAEALEAFGRGDADKAFSLWGEVAKSPSKAYKSLALMHQGGVRLAAGKTNEAVKLFDQAAEAAPNPVLGDASGLKSALALLDTAPYKSVEARLTPLMQDGRPYRLQAREALAFAKLMAGDMAGAREEFVVVSLLPDAGQGARERAKAAMALIDSGAAKAVPGAVKAAAALPPLPPQLAIPSSGPTAEPAPQPQTPDAQ